MNFDKEVIIKRKITIGDIFILGVLFVISFACFYGVFNEGLDTNFGLLIVGLLFGIIFLLIFPYCTFKKPYFKVNSQGIYAKLPKGFTYGKEELVSWDEILGHINQDKDIIEDEMVELNEEFIENYINILRKKMKKIDIYLMNGINPLFY